jgi:hypothetical protein
MTPPPSPGLGSSIFETVAKAINGTAAVAEPLAAATLSVVETLISLIHAGIASDIGRIKESLIQRIEARTVGEQAEAAKKIEEATEAANRATLHKRRDGIALAERRKAEAEAAKSEAEAEAILLRARNERMAAIADATAKLADVISRLRQHGGEVFFSEESLRRIIELGASELPNDPD